MYLPGPRDEEAIEAHWQEVEKRVDAEFLPPSVPQEKAERELDAMLAGEDAALYDETGQA